MTHKTGLDNTDKKIRAFGDRYVLPARARFYLEKAVQIFCNVLPICR